MILQKQLRIPILAITFCGLLFTLGKTMLDPNIGKPTPFTFPAEVPLPKWQQQASRPIAEKKAEHPELVAGKHYSYISNKRSLDIEMRYMGNTDGNVQKLIPEYTSIKLPANNSKLVLSQADGVGFYSLFNENGRSYLSACINPRGGSTVTSGQFTDNRNKYDFQSGRIVPWLLGQEKLRDQRCLWTLLSTSEDSAAPDSGYKVLENAWISWHEWWQPRFPKY